MALHRFRIPLRLCDDVLCEVKSFEICKNDEDYRVGDKVIFSAVNGEKTVNHKINEAMFEITYIEKLDDLRQGYIAFSVRRV